MAYFGNYNFQMTIPTSTVLLELELLHQLGDRLRRLRKEQGLGTVALAEQLGISRPTLRAVEAGDPNTAIGTYLRVMSALGIGAELALLGSDAMRPVTKGTAAARSPRPRPSVRVTVSANPGSSRLSDLQSLALHSEALRLIKQDDQLRQRAIDTVSTWLHKEAHSRSAPLWHEWERILTNKTFRQVLGRSAHAQQLRQASPMPTVLPDEVRSKVMNEVRQIKTGLVLDGSIQGGAP